MKPRSIKRKRQLAYDAWIDWQNGEMSGIERDERSKYYLEYAGLDSGIVFDADAIVEKRRAQRKAEYGEMRAKLAADKREEENRVLAKRAKRQNEKNREKTLKAIERNEYSADKLLYKAAQKRTLVNDIAFSVSVEKNNIANREKAIREKLAVGANKIFKESKQKPEKRDKGIQNWQDSAERSIRKAIDDNAKKEAILKQENYRKDNDRKPGIEWKGGQLRSGNMTGQKTDYRLAALEIADKYFRSTMPRFGIVPNMNVRGESGGEIIDASVPVEIVAAMMKQAKDGQQPDATELIEWLQEWCEENEIDDDEIDLFADNAIRH